MKVFCDLHHADLYYSLQLLFEKRLGWEMYRPIGLEWQQQGFWKIYDHPATAQQFLSLDQSANKPTDVRGNCLPKHQQLNLNYRFEDGIYYVYDSAHDKIQRAITLEKLQSMDFDILISSIPIHIQPFNKLIQLYQPKAKHIFQVGNAWGHQSGVTNILSSTAPFNVPSGINICFYHQEFDLNTYIYESPDVHNVINSYIHYMSGPEILDQYRFLLPEFSITTYGSGMNGILNGAIGVAEAMKNSAWTYHYKPRGDGYGHSIHSSYACGRPTLIWGSQYAGKLASNLFIHQQTCIDMSLNSPKKNAQLIREWSKPDQHKAICQNVYNRFREIVDFDAEEQQIRKFIGKL